MDSPAVKPAEKIQFIGNLSRLQLQKGDRFVLQVKEEISDQVCSIIRKQWDQFTGGGVPLLILPPGFKLGAIGAPELIESKR